MPEIGLGIFRPLYYSPDLLWRWKAGWAGGSFARASAAWYTGPDGLIHQAASGVPRIEWYDLDGDGVRETPTTLLEPAATNLLRDSCNLPASGSAWGSTSNFSVSPATSIFAGQTAWRHTNLGLVTSPSRPQTIGTLTGQPETASAIIENVDAAETILSLFDVTRQAHVCAGRLAWATGATSLFSGVGTVIARKLATAGPNGGPVYRLMVTGTGTAGNQRQIRLYATGTSQNTQAAIVHHVQHEVGAVATSPIVTTTAAVTRAADALTFSWPHPPQPMTGYLRFIEAGALAYSDTRVLMHIGQGTTAPWLFVRKFAGLSAYGIGYTRAAGVGTSSNLTSAPVPAIGDLVELVWRLYPDGSVQIEQSINGGAPVVAARSAAIGLPTAWSVQILRLSGVPSATSEAPAAWRDVLIFKDTAITWDEIRALVGT